jgi:hypothetical protein
LCWFLTHKHTQDVFRFQICSSPSQMRYVSRQVSRMGMLRKERLKKAHIMHSEMVMRFVEDFQVIQFYRDTLCCKYMQIVSESVIIFLKIK